jgi:hypothetical protein
MYVSADGASRLSHSEHHILAKNGVMSQSVDIGDKVVNSSVCASKVTYAYPGCSIVSNRYFARSLKHTCLQDEIIEMPPGSFTIPLGRAVIIRLQLDCGSLSFCWNLARSGWVSLIYSPLVAKGTFCSMSGNRNRLTQIWIFPTEQVNWELRCAF